MLNELFTGVKLKVSSYNQLCELIYNNANKDLFTMKKLKKYVFQFPVVDNCYTRYKTEVEAKAAGNTYLVVMATGLKEAVAELNKISPVE